MFANKKLLAHLCLAGAAVIYGANYPIAKSVMPEPFPPTGYIFLRVLGAGLLFGLLALTIREKIDRKDWPRLFFCGLTGVATNQLFFFMGLERTSPINAAIIMTSNPILVMVIAAIVLKNRITVQKGLGVLLGAAGAIGTILLSAGDASNLSDPTGDAMILVNSTSYAIYLVIVKPLMAKYQPITVVSWAFIFGFVIVTPVGFSDFASVDWSSFGAWEWFATAFVVLGTTFLAYLFNIVALRHVMPTVSSAYIYFQPILAGVFAWLLSLFTHLNYTGDFSWMKAGYALLIFIGVFLVSVPLIGGRWGKQPAD